MYEIKNWRENTGQSKVKGWFTLVIRDFEINDLSLVEGDKGNFVSFPSRPYKDKDGEQKYASIVWMPVDARRYAFQDWALKELEKFVGIEPELPEDKEKDDIPF